MTITTKISLAAATALVTALAAVSGGSAAAFASGALTVTASSGSPQYTTVGTAFPSPLVATVSGLSPGAGCPGTVNFDAPVSGPSAKFSASGTAIDGAGPSSATADATGSCVYDSSALSANGVAGTYDVRASVPGASGTADFFLTNDGIAASGGTPQTAQDGSPFPTPLQVAVFADGAPVVGATVDFSAPSSGATGVFSSTNNHTATAVTTTMGVATAPEFTANDSPGTYTVSASTSAVSGTASFSLTNSAAGVASSIISRSGTPQSAAVGTTYADPLEATVVDGNGNPVQGAMVTFSVSQSSGAGGAGGTFVGAGGSATVPTDSAGVATSPEVEANDVSGSFTVSATTPGISTAADFTLTNLASAPTTVLPGAGGTQQASVDSTFVVPLSVTVTDVDGNRVPGVSVTFAAPSSGPSGTFSSTGTNSVTVVTNASGIAVAPPFRANGTTGGYIVTASARGVSPAVAFAMVNEASGSGTSAPQSSGAAESYVGMARTVDGKGYWLVGRDGGVFTFGDAHFYGSVPGDGIHVSDIVGMVSTTNGGGYWLVGSDGGVFAFGDASFHGSMGGRHLAQPVVGMAATPDGHGYWLVASDGGIFSFGDASFHGSVPGDGINVADVVGIAAVPTGGGYWLVGRDGGVFSFDAAYHGSVPGDGIHVSGVVGAVTTPNGGGYWLVASGGGVFSFGDAAFLGSPA